MLQLSEFRNNTPLLTYDLEAWRAITRGYSPVRVAPGTLLWQQAQMPQDIAILSGGYAKILKYAHDGTENTLYLAGPGCILSEDSAMSGYPLMYTAVAIPETWLYFIPKQVFLQEIQENLRFIWDFIEYRNKKSSLFSARLVAQSLTRIPQRMAVILLGACYNCGRETAQGIEIQLRLTHYLWGSLIGANRVTVTRVLLEFEQKGYIGRHGGHLVVRNAQALIAIAEGRG